MEDASIIVQGLALECCAFLETAASAVFDLDGWWWLPERSPPHAVPSPLNGQQASPELRLRHHEDQEARVRCHLEATSEAVFRLLAAHAAALAALQFQWLRHAALSTICDPERVVQHAYEQANVAKALHWAEACVACVGVLLEEFVNVPVQQPADATHQRARCRLWFRVLAGWCHCTTL